MTNILITNRKGGVGKTTTTINLSYGFSKLGYKVLVVDLDTQGHIQYGLGIKNDFTYGIHHALYDSSIGTDVIIHKSQIENLSFIPASINYNSSVLQDREILKRILSQVEEEFDICLIDTAPMSDTVLEMSILASKYVIVPMKTEYLGLIGTIQFIKIFYNMASSLNTEFKLLGILPTLYSKSMKEHKETIAELRKIVGAQRVLPPVRRDNKMNIIYKEGLKTLEKEHSMGMNDYNSVLNDILIKIK